MEYFLDGLKYERKQKFQKAFECDNYSILLEENNKKDTYMNLIGILMTFVLGL